MMDPAVYKPCCVLDLKTVYGIVVRWYWYVARSPGHNNQATDVTVTVPVDDVVTPLLLLLW